MVSQPVLKQAPGKFVPWFVKLVMILLRTQPCSMSAKVPFGVSSQCLLQICLFSLTFLKIFIFFLAFPIEFHLNKYIDYKGH